MKEVWDREVEAEGNVHNIENLAQMGRNIVPWNLGGLSDGHALKILDFRSAFSFLSRGGCRSIGDLFKVYACPDLGSPCFVCWD